MNSIKYVILAVVLSLLTGCALIGATALATNSSNRAESNYSFEGDFDPGDFLEWDIIGSEQYLQDGFWHTINKYKNPDVESPVVYIIGIYVAGSDGWVLVSFGYQCEGSDYVYVLDPAKNHFYLFSMELSEPQGLSI